MTLSQFVGDEHEIFEAEDVEDVTISAGVFGEVVFVSLNDFYLINRDEILVNVSMIPFQHRLPIAIVASFFRREEPDFRFAGLLRLTDRFVMDKDCVRRNE